MSQRWSALFCTTGAWGLKFLTRKYFRPHRKWRNRYNNSRKDKKQRCSRKRISGHNEPVRSHFVASNSLCNDYQCYCKGKGLKGQWLCIRLEIAENIMHKAISQSFMYTLENLRVGTKNRIFCPNSNNCPNSSACLYSSGCPNSKIFLISSWAPGKNTLSQLLDQWLWKIL